MTSASTMSGSVPLSASLVTSGPPQLGLFCQRSMPRSMIGSVTAFGSVTTALPVGFANASAAPSD